MAATERDREGKGENPCLPGQERARRRKMKKKKKKKKKKKDGPRNGPNKERAGVCLAGRSARGRGRGHACGWGLRARARVPALSHGFSPVGWSGERLVLLEFLLPGNLVSTPCADGTDLK